MKKYNGDVLDADVDVICHVTNNYHCFGSGIAATIARRYPQVFDADKETEPDCDTKLGSFSKAEIDLNRVIYNLYAMWGIGNDGHPLHRNLSYDSFYNAVFSMCEDILYKSSKIFNPVVIGVPAYIGCCRAGGEWDIVLSILKNIEDKFDGNIHFHIYELDNGEMARKVQSTTPSNYEIKTDE